MREIKSHETERELRERGPDERARGDRLPETGEKEEKEESEEEEEEMVHDPRSDILEARKGEKLGE